MIHSQPSAPLPPEFLGAVFALDLPQACVDELAADPADAGGILLDFADGLRHSDPDRAQRLLGVLRERAPEPVHRQYAVHMAAGILRGQGEAAEADRLIDELMDPGTLLPETAFVLAEDFETDGDLERALACYNVSCRGLLAHPADLVAGLDPLGLIPLLSRARLRGALGHAPDAHDEAALSADGRQATLRDELDLLDEQLHGPAGTDGGTAALVVLDPSSHARARAEGRVPEQSAADYYLAAERRLRTWPGERPAVVLAGLDEVADLLGDEDGLARWARDTAPEGSPRRRPWPPERNRPCWCGSERKYKKCCGAPSTG
ncbi:SEC-C domain-containing protein [Nocardiopsis sp. LOL_012]|uniref:SEC-C domain-containing protein n=1 Tax=Nocardiopsis sp. LOL_012 TaxID=3345409 RepID=UPI003A87E285